MYIDRRRNRRRSARRHPTCQERLRGRADRKAWWAAYHLSSLVELKSSRELFIDAHRLVDSFPDTAEAWYAVGCYYYLCGKFEKARINFLKATSLNPYLAPAWCVRA